MKVGFKQLLCLSLYYAIAQYLPDSYSPIPFLGKFSVSTQ